MEYTQQIRAYIEKAFADFPKTQATTELKEELCANLTEKYSDLVRRGMAPEEAYKIVLDGIGDLGELRGSVGQDGQAEPLPVPVQEDDRYGAGATKAQSFSVPLRSVVVDWLSGDVRVLRSDDGKLHLVERAESLTESELFQAAVTGDTLTVKDGRQSFLRNLFGFGWLRALAPVTLEVYLPSQEYALLKLNAISGNLLGDELRAERLHGETISGRVELSGTFQESRIKTISGSITFSGEAGKASLEAVSGKLRFTGGASECHAQVVSGSMDLDLAQLPERMDISAVSGRVSVHIPDNDGFTLRYDKVSGHLTSDFPMIERGNERIYKNGAVPIRVNTVSGGCSLLCKR